MNDKLFDQYTYLHFAFGIVSYFWGISLKNTIIMHTIYEIFEVTPFGVNFINTYFKNIWPGGGKKKSEYGINAFGDTIGIIIGWLSSMKLDQIGQKYGWYELHIK